MTNRETVQKLRDDVAAMGVMMSRGQGDIQTRLLIEILDRLISIDEKLESRNG